MAALSSRPLMSPVPASTGYKPDLVVSRVPKNSAMILQRIDLAEPVYVPVSSPSSSQSNRAWLPRRVRLEGSYESLTEDKTVETIVNRSHHGKIKRNVNTDKMDGFGGNGRATISTTKSVLELDHMTTGAATNADSRQRTPTSEPWKVMLYGKHVKSLRQSRPSSQLGSSSALKTYERTPMLIGNGGETHEGPLDALSVVTANAARSLPRIKIPTQRSAPDAGLSSAVIPQAVQLKYYNSLLLDSQPSSKTAGQTGVQDILMSINGQGRQDLLETLKLATPVARNFAILALGNSKKHSEIRLIADLMQQHQLSNEHTFGAVISALDQAGRFDMSIQYFEGLYRRGIDVGPICSSVLVKLCTRRRDLSLAMDIFHRLSGHSTLNRYTYNCLIHLCAVLGRPEEAVTVLRMMYEDGSPESKPDSYTYTALLRVVTKSQKWDLLPRIFRGMQRSKIEMDTLVWCSLISVADKAGRLDVATEYYEASKAHRSGGKADLLICNHYLVALVHHGPLSAVLTAYRSMLDDGFQPDVYSFNALFSAMADAGASLYAVQDLISEMAKWNIKMNTHLGTSMIHAYKRCPEMIHGDPRMASLLMERAHDLLNELVSQRQANHQTFTAVASMHAKLGDIKGVQEVLHLMDTQGVTADGLAFYHIGKSCEDGGLIELSKCFYEKAESRGVQVTDKMQKIKSRKKNKSKEPAALHWMPVRRNIDVSFV